MTYGEDSYFIACVLAKTHAATLIPQSYYYYFKNRQGNVVSSKPDERSLQFMDNAYLLYLETKRCKQGVCGVHRVFVAANEVLSRIPYAERAKYRPLIQKCSATLRKTAILDRIRYICDQRFNLGFKGKVLCILYLYFPLAALYIRKGLRGK